jgi:hypothetical protein
VSAVKPLDKVLMMGVYVFKTAGFAGLAGLALFAVAARVNARLRSKRFSHCPT